VGGILDEFPIIVNKGYGYGSDLDGDNSNNNIIFQNISFPLVITKLIPTCGSSKSIVYEFSYHGEGHYMACYPKDISEAYH